MTCGTLYPNVFAACFVSCAFVWQHKRWPPPANPRTITCSKNMHPCQPSAYCMGIQVLDDRARYTKHFWLPDGSRWYTVVAATRSFVPRSVNHVSVVNDIVPWQTNAWNHAWSHPTAHHTYWTNTNAGMCSWPHGNGLGTVKGWVGQREVSAWGNIWTIAIVVDVYSSHSLLDDDPCCRKQVAGNLRWRWRHLLLALLKTLSMCRIYTE